MTISSNSVRFGHNLVTVWSQIIHLPALLVKRKLTLSGSTIWWVRLVFQFGCRLAN